MRLSIFFILIFFLFFSCNKNNEGNEYFHEIALKIRLCSNNDSKIKAIVKEEEVKFNRTHDRKYFLSTKFVKSFLSYYTANQHVAVLYDLLRYNDDEYIFITSYCNLSLAYCFEYSSPKLAMGFIDSAIRCEEKLQIKYFLSHEYHAKGRFYYNEANYSKALLYFDKALKITNPDEPLYSASMYNNFALTYEKLDQIGAAIKETKKGINVLEKIPNPNWEQIEFIHNMKGHLGYYLMKSKNFNEAEKYLLDELNFNSKKQFQSKLVITLKNLIELYRSSQQLEKYNKVIQYIIKIAPTLKSSKDRITANEIIHEFYIINNADRKLLKDSYENVVLANHVFDKENNNRIKETSLILDNQIIRNIDEKYARNLSIQRKITGLIITIAILLISIFYIIIYNARTKNKKIESLFESNTKFLQQNIELRNEKIKSLHQNLHLKKETQKMFLDNLRQLRKDKNVDSEQLLKDLLIKVTNLIQIDKRYDILTNESSIENNQFMSRLSDKWPNLTKRELKLCTYFRMDLSSKEISSLEGATIGTIRVYKTKIKNKIGIPKDEGLTSYLAKI